eukprot:GFUD01016637.1.p1 GENE.GFUD01016637.1~~GFUD01016637.1.p1  ORF type:complete len:155 (-),score=33.31 GFUD01016637.1:142-606(-)
MSSDQQEPYMEMFRNDKLLLQSNLNYRKDRKRKASSRVENVAVENVEDVEEIMINIQEEKSEQNEKNQTAEPSLCCLLEEVKSLDIQISDLISVRHKQNQETPVLKIQSDMKVRELNELDRLIAEYRNKCRVLKKKKTSESSAGMEISSEATPR